MKSQPGIKKTKGFTLIELVIAIAILAVLAAVAVPSISGYLRQGKITTAITDATQLALAINTYSTTCKKPIDASDLDSALEQVLIDNNLLPKLTADFDNVLNNLEYDPDARFFDAKPQEDINLDGY